MAFAVTGWPPGSSLCLVPANTKSIRGAPLMDFHSPSECGPGVERPQFTKSTPKRRLPTAPRLRFEPLQRFPAMGSGFECAGLPHPRANAFRFSQPLGASPPNAWRPLFQVTSALGVRPSELFSSRAAVRRLRRLLPSGRSTQSGYSRHRFEDTPKEPKPKRHVNKPE